MLVRLVDSAMEGSDTTANSEVQIMAFGDALPGEQEPPVDWEVARSLTGGSEDLLEELAGMFPDESARHIATIDGAISAGDAQALRRGAHSLKTAAGFFGAKRLIACALQMEEFGAAGDIDAARLHLDELRSQTAAVTAAVRQYAV